MAYNKAYREAEKKIEEARRTGATELDLNPGWDTKKRFEIPDDEKLTQLPESLSQLTRLQSLDLANNKLTDVPEAIGHLTRLQSLNLASNQLKAAAETIGQLTQLRSLDLSFNQLTDVPETTGQLTQLQSLNLAYNQLTDVPEAISQLTQLQSLDFQNNLISKIPEFLRNFSVLEELTMYQNQIRALPSWIGELHNLWRLGLGGNGLTELPDSLGELSHLETLVIGGNPIQKIPTFIQNLPNLKNLYFGRCELTSIPAWLGKLMELEIISLVANKIADIPLSLAELNHLKTLDLDDNPLNPELAAAYMEGLNAVKAYLRAKAGAQITLNEAKLILVGEGEVGKTCLMDALEGKPWQEHPTTHGIEIRTIAAADLGSGKAITLNAWDFGGQRVYRPTHQLFFSSPAVYLVVWKLREGPQQGFVKEWIKLIKHREPDAKILVVATHGGPQQRQPDIDRQELWDLFGKETVLDFFHVDSKPDDSGQRRGIAELKQAIARVAAALPEMGREVPESFQKTRQALAKTDAAYLPLTEVHTICYEHGMEKQLAKLFVAISHRLGHLIHYEHDPFLRDIVVLKPDWLTTAISFVLDDKETREAQGLIPFSRLTQLWNDPSRKAADRYPADLHPIFLRLMERFDLSYQVAGLSTKDNDNVTSLIAQLVPSIRPEQRLAEAWPPTVTAGDTQQVQICRIVDEKGQSAPAEGLFYQLIVRLHRYSLGRAHYHDSVHWQRGLILDDDYNGNALLEHKGNDVHIIVRAPYPEGFLHRLTGDVKYLVESFWEGLRCDVMVPCIHPCGQDAPGIGLYEVGKLIDSKRKKRPEYPCPVCHEWQPIDSLLRNAPAAQPLPTHVLDNREVLVEVRKLHGRFDKLDKGQAILLSQADANFNTLIQVFTDEAKEGPRLFTFEPVDRTSFNPKEWTSAKFRLTLWCEHSRMPLPLLDPIEGRKGFIELELTRDWFRKSAPYLKFLTGTLSLVLPIATSSIEFSVNDAAFEAMEEQLNLGSDIIDASLTGGQKATAWLGSGDSANLQQVDQVNRAEGAMLRELHVLLKEKDSGFGGLVRVRNKRQEFLWVHPQFEKEY